MTSLRVLLPALLFVTGCERHWAEHALTARGSKPEAPPVTYEAERSFFLAKKRGAEAIGCAPLDVTVESLDGGAFRVRGCEASATVVCSQATDLTCIVETVARD